jgi:phage protein D
MQPKFTLWYNRTRIPFEKLGENSFYIESIDYTDRRNGEADELDIELYDRNDVFKNQLFPVAGDIIKIVFEFGKNRIKTPEFFLDSYEFDIEKKTVRLRGLSYLYEKDSNIRKKRNVKYASTGLRTIVSSIAQRNNYKLIWFGSDFNIDFLWQKRKSDYKLLKELSKEYGAFFKIHNKNLVWSLATDNYTFEVVNGEVLATTGSATRYLDMPKDMFSTLNIVLEANKKSKAQFETLDVFNNKLNKTIGKKSDKLDLGPLSTEELNIRTNKDNVAKGSVVSDNIKGNLKVRGVVPIWEKMPVLAQNLQSGAIIFIPDQGKLKGTYVIDSNTESFSASSGWVKSIDCIRLTSEDIPKPTNITKYNNGVNSKVKLKRDVTAEVLKQMGITSIISMLDPPKVQDNEKKKVGSVPPMIARP